MLKLTRRTGEAVVATLADGRTVTVTVLEIREGKVRIGVEADRDLLVWREELGREAALRLLAKSV